MLKVIIFDFFDVLAPDFYRVWLEKNNLQRTGEYLKIAQDIDSGQITLDSYYSRLAELCGQSASSLKNEFENNVDLNHQLFGLIKSLRKQYKIVLLTNSPANMVRIILQNNSLEQYFDAIIISGEVGYVKPQPEIFQLALDSVQALAREAIFIDDLAEYLAGAKRVGIKGIRYKSYEKIRKELAQKGVNVA